MGKHDAVRDKLSFITLSKEEIFTLYRDAKDKEAQIGILADLCMCTKKAMREFLGVKSTKKETKKRGPYRPYIQYYLDYDDVAKKRAAGVRWDDIADDYGYTRGRDICWWFHRQRKKREKEKEG